MLLIIISQPAQKMSGPGQTKNLVDQYETQRMEREEKIKQASEKLVVDLNFIYKQRMQSETRNIKMKEPQQRVVKPKVDQSERDYAVQRTDDIYKALVVINSKLRYVNVPQELANKVAGPLGSFQTQLEKSLKSRDWLWKLEQGNSLDQRFTSMLIGIHELDRRVDNMINQKPKGLCGGSGEQKINYAALITSCERLLYTADLFASLYTLVPLAPQEIKIIETEQVLVPMDLDNNKEQIKIHIQDLMLDLPEIVKTVEIPIMPAIPSHLKQVVSRDDGKVKQDNYLLAQNHFFGYGYPKNIARAVELLETSGEKDNCSEAAVFLGRIYLEGDGVGQSDPEAFRWFALASRLGNTTGIYWEGFMYEKNRVPCAPGESEGQISNSNKMKADQLYRDAASGLDGKAKVSPEALFALARFRDASRPAFDTEVVDLLERACELDNLDAASMLGEMYAEGRVPGHSAQMSQKKAFELISRAAKRGHSEAQTNLGKLHLMGYAGEKSFADARIWFEKAAEKRDPESIFYLGYLIYMEALPAKNFKALYKANMHFRHVLTINPNHDDALYYLADMLENGWGGSKDLVIAAENYKACIDSNPNHAKALFKLGRIYLEGKGIVHSDKHLALQYMQSSARLGNPNAGLYLGDLYTMDGVVKKDVKSAMQFYIMAAERGSAEAKMKQAQLIKRNPYMFSQMIDAETLERQAKAAGYLGTN